MVPNKVIPFLILILFSINVYSKPVHKEIIGIASYYGAKFHKKKTASGERFNQWAMTAAHKTLPFGTRVKITNLSNHKSIIVTVTDRGPFVKNRIIDLAKGAALKIHITGLEKVKMKILPG